MSLSKADVHDIWNKVQENAATLRKCRRHHFSATAVKMGDRLTCDNCGGVMGLTSIGDYIRGYEAGGGSSGDIWPGFYGKQ